MNETLSICIPTYNRAALLRECLDTLLPQVAKHAIPIYVSDNASPDDTMAMLQQYKSERYPQLFFQSAPRNLGIDRNVANVMEMPRSRYCWLCADDDLLHAGAIDAVLDKLAGGFDLVLVNASMNSYDYGIEVEERRMAFQADRAYEPGQHNDLLRDTGSFVTYLGSLVVDRQAWLACKAAPYATDFYHFAVAFTYAVGRRAAVVAYPYTRIRLSNSSWTPRMFEVLMVNWPKAVWLLGPAYDREAKTAVTIPDRATSPRHLLGAKALGMFDARTFDTWLAPLLQGAPLSRKLMVGLLARMPEALCRWLFSLYLNTTRVAGYRLYLYEMTMRARGIK